MSSRTHGLSNCKSWMRKALWSALGQNSFQVSKVILQLSHTPLGLTFAVLRRGAARIPLKWPVSISFCYLVPSQCSYSVVTAWADPRSRLETQSAVLIAMVAVSCSPRTRTLLFLRSQVARRRAGNHSNPEPGTALYLGIQAFGYEVVAGGGSTQEVIARVDCRICYITYPFGSDAKTCRNRVTGRITFFGLSSPHQHKIVST